MTEVVSEGLVRGTLHRAQRASAGIVLAHGAGSDSNSRLMTALASAFAEAGYDALRIDLPFRQVRPAGPPHPSTADQDRQGIREALALLRNRGVVYFGGHSYGGRQGSIAIADDPNAADGILLLSYPLHPPAKPTQLRTDHFPRIVRPALFVHGTRDPFGTPDELREALLVIPAHTELYLLHGAGHELKPVITDPGEIVQRFGMSAT